MDIVGDLDKGKPFGNPARILHKEQPQRRQKQRQKEYQHSGQPQISSRNRRKVIVVCFLNNVKDG